MLPSGQVTTSLLINFSVERSRPVLRAASASAMSTMDLRSVFTGAL